MNEQKNYVVQLNKIKEGMIIPFVSDAMFEVMINNEKHIQYASYIISHVLKIDREEIEKHIHLKKTELNKMYPKAKGRRVDFVAEIGKKIINIEMNNNGSDITKIRNYKYATDLYQSRIEEGRGYDKEEVMVQININNYVETEECPSTEIYAMRSDRREKVLVDNFRIVNFYLPEIRRKYYNKEEISEVERILLVMSEEKIEEAKEIGKGDKIMEEYIRESMEASKNKKILGEYDKELDDRMIRTAENKEYYDNGVEEGYEQGEYSKTLSIVKNMLMEDLPLEMIRKVTGLSQEEINRISV